MYEIYTLKVGEKEVDTSVTFFEEYGSKCIIAFYFWCLKGNGRVILVDTGLSPDGVKKRKMAGAINREELLRQIGVSAHDVDTVVLSHLHGDHFEDPSVYSKAVFYIQRREVEFWSGEIQGAFPGKSKGDIVALQKLNMAGRVRFLDGDSSICPGLNTLELGGHTPGQQVVTVETVRGTVLLCTDFCDMYRNLEERIPGKVLNLPEWLRNFPRIERMGLPKHSIIPGHDPLVLTKFPRIGENIGRVA